MSVGTGTTTLTGSGTYIFRSTGALTSAANSILALAGGASACSLWWTPGAATTLGANSTFLGTDIDPSGITIGSTVGWTGRALGFGGTVSTTTDTLSTVPICSARARLRLRQHRVAELHPRQARTPRRSLNTGLALKPIGAVAGAILLIAVVTKFWKRPYYVGRD